MVNDIEFLETVCERMQQVGLVQSKADFSIRMLGKGPSYLTSMSARDRKVPNEVIAHLAGNLQDVLNNDETALADLRNETTQRELGRAHCLEVLGCVRKHEETTASDFYDRSATRQTWTDFLALPASFSLRWKVFR